MNKGKFSNYNFQKWLFLLGISGFVLALLKNFFLDQHPGAGYYVVELLAFLFFLTAIFISDKNNQMLRKNLEISEKINHELKQNNIKKVDELQSIIAGYEAKQNEATRFASYQDQVIKKLTSDRKVYEDKYHFLHLISELFHAMAIVLFKKDEPSGLFVVEETYGLPEDFESPSFEKGEGIHGQAVVGEKPTLIDEVPEEYVPVSTGLGSTRQYFIYMLPVIKEDGCTGLVELMTFKETDVQRLWPGVMEKLVAHGVL